MKIVFRVDASASIGTGHLMRCLTLAEALRERDAQIRFFCREHTGNLITLLRQKAMPVTVLPAPTTDQTTLGEDYAAWLGVTQAEDAEQTLEALNDEKPDWLVVDHYGLDVEWEQRLRPHIGKLMVIDDLANRYHDCDVLLDQNYSAEGERRYAGLVPDDCTLLVGPRYALLRPEYAAYRKTLCARDGQIRRVLVFFGGTDPENVTGMALEALSHPDLKHLEVDVVIGVNNPHRKTIGQQVLHRPLTTLHEPRPHLADLMAKADLAIGAGGATTWERMCLGLPSVVVSIAGNQQPASKVLAGAQMIYYLGHSSDVKPGQLSLFILKLSSEASTLADMSAREQLEVDGLGVARAREILLPTLESDLCLRAACEEDLNIFYSWVNDTEVRKSSFQSAPIPWLTHKDWFARKLNDPNSHLYVLEAEGLPVGQIRFDKVGNEANIDYSLDVLVRGRGWGVRLVSLGLAQLQNAEPIRVLAKVKTDNGSSRSVFSRLGFAVAESKNNCLIFHRSI